ncbi:MAG: 2-oxo acid dehydrogenase subunit E2 [Litoreibacter sp.]|nr:2-oxo acid dehydrogenase subunit E2 [Litoreibacter sp.]
MTVFKLPDLGEGLQEAEIVAWHVSEGDHVIADQPLVSVETDKAVVEIPAPYSGTIARLIASEGDVLEIGGALLEIATGTAEDTGAIVGELGEAAELGGPSLAQLGDRSTRGRASPAVRRLAKEKGVDLSAVAGTGPDGAILTRDVEAAAPGVLGEDLRGVRRAMAHTMTRSHAVVVPATVTERADISDWSEAEKPTPRLIRAIVAASKAEPALNAWFDGTRRQLHDHVDLALAVDTPDGLFVPVLRDVAVSTDIDAALERVKRAVRDRSIAPEDMKRATISLSNFGPIGGELAALVVSPPQVAILGAGRISRQCGFVDGQPAARRILPLSLTFDHRVVTGGEAARFLAALRDHLEGPSAQEGGGS